MFFVKVTLMYTGIYLCNTILVTEIFRYRYSTINNSTKKQYFPTKFSDRCRDLLRIECTKFYSDLFRFDIFLLYEV